MPCRRPSRPASDTSARESLSSAHHPVYGPPTGGTSMPTDRRLRALRTFTLAALALLAAPRVDAKGGGKTVTLTIGPFAIEARRAREVCRAVRVPHGPGMEILSSEVRSRSYRHGAVGTHHFIAYGYRGAHSADFPPPSDLVDDPGCNGFGPVDFFSNRV